MTPEQFLEIGKVLGVPAAVAAVLLFLGVMLTWQAVKGVKWIGQRLLGDNGIGTRAIDRHIQFMDTVERNDDKHADSLQAISACMEKLTVSEDEHYRVKHDKLREIHQDVIATKEGVQRLEFKRGIGSGE